MGRAKDRSMGTEQGRHVLVRQRTRVLARGALVYSTHAARRRRKERVSNLQEEVVVQEGEEGEERERERDMAGLLQLLLWRCLAWLPSSPTKSTKWGLIGGAPL